MFDQHGVLMSDTEPLSVRSVLQQHAALVVSAGLAAFTVLRLVRVANGEETTAHAILRYVGTADVILASVVVLVPFAVVWAVVGSIVHALNQRDFWTYASFIAITGVTAVAITPVAVLAVAAGTGLLWIPPLVARQRDRATVQRAIVFFLGIASSPLIVSSAFWLPPEVITTQTSVHVGYVLDDEDPDSLVLLGEDDRQVTRIATNSVESRSFCEIRSAGPNWLNRMFDTPLLGFLRKMTDYPQCATTTGAEDT